MTDEKNNDPLEWVFYTHLVFSNLMAANQTGFIFYYTTLIETWDVKNSLFEMF